MRKARIKIRANIVIRADIYETARLADDNQRDVTINIADSDDEADIDYANVDLVEFGGYTKSSLANSVQKTRRRWAIEDQTNSNKISYQKKKQTLIMHKINLFNSFIIILHQESQS